MALSAFSLAAHLLWPSRCSACDALVAEAHAFCEGCRAGLLRLVDPCPGCALPMPATPDAGLCRKCREAPPPFGAAAAAVVYGGPVAEALVRWKHGGRLDLARPLALTLVAAWPRACAFDAIVPVPLHPRRLRQRGFNQALALARAGRSALPREERRPILVDALRRTRDTPSLGHFSPAERRALVAGAFAVRDPRQVAGLRLLLVDDVMTTGATFTACALALRLAGAAEVAVLALARAV